MKNKLFLILFLVSCNSQNECPKIDQIRSEFELHRMQLKQWCFEVEQYTALMNRFCYKNKENICIEWNERFQGDFPVTCEMNLELLED